MLWIVAIGGALIWASLAFTGLGRLLKRAVKAVWRGITKVFSMIGVLLGCLLCKRRRKAKREGAQTYPHQPTRSHRHRHHRHHHRHRHRHRSPSPSNIWGDGSWEMDLEKMGLSVESLEMIGMVFAWMVLPFIGQWLFWAGFLRLASDL
jgi:hypothetical protein